MKFKFKEDEIFFIDLLNEDFKWDYFDFSEPKEKRKKFNKNRNSILEKLISENGQKCQLNYIDICDESTGFVVDHIIPLSTNVLNKKLRNQKPVDKNHKVQSESYGSNNYCNLIIACNKCNAYKKNKILDDHTLKKLIYKKNLSL